ncbi:MAG: tripartite tricarboxylate transporter TctB family protein [Candidatus Rokubacteria bacterium]|nr:tripartite tricarboxylate transporter TctB family protein [Candidatus Rokubacteria bacterium]
MRAANLITAAILAAVGVLVLVDALRLGIRWGTDGPQSGFFPFWLAVLLIGCCLAIAVKAGRRASPYAFVTRQALGPVLAVVGPAAAFVVLTQAIGLYVAAALYLAFYMRWVGRHSWAAAAGLAVAFPVITFLVFERWFLVPMPKGPLEAWLGY